MNKKESRVDSIIGSIIFFVVCMWLLICFCQPYNPPAKEDSSPYMSEMVSHGAYAATEEE